MRPLNRPMFKMGGPVKEGIMDGIREPKADGGNIGGGVIEGRPAGKGRTGFNIINLIGGGIAALRTAGPAAVRGFQAARTLQPGKLGVLGRTKDIFSVRGGLGLPMASRPESVGFRVGSFARQNPFLTLSTPSLGTSLVTGGGPLAIDAAKGVANFLVPGERFDPFKGEKQDENVGQRSSTLGQRGKSGDTINRQTEKGNQFNDDGSKKETSVSRLLKAVEKRSRDAAVADSLIAAGEEIRTGGIDSDTVGNITQRVSKEFDKDVDLRQKLDLARIESELKKEQIAAQAIATDPVNIEIRKRKLTTIGDLDRADRGGVRYGVKGGIRLLAQDFEQLTGVQFQGSLGGDDELKRIADTEAFKLNPESVIKDSIENIKTSDGNIIAGENGTYMLGNQLYEYTNGVVKRLK
jgi:hypothetical protein